MSIIEFREKWGWQQSGVGISKLKKIPPWSDPDAAAGAAAATSAAASAVCIYGETKRGCFVPL